MAGGVEMVEMGGGLESSRLSDSVSEERGQWGGLDGGQRR